MLWTEITNVVTRDGLSLAGTAVRDWLKARRVLPDTYANANVVIETCADPKVVLRTRAEIEAWLLDVQLCTSVTFAPVPSGNVQGRHGARGGSQQNPNSLPLRIEIYRQPEGTATTRESLVQGQRLRIEARLLPAPGNKPRDFEIAFLGAKIRSRDAIRSVLAPDSGYRYLSRVRVARNADGIRSPFSEMNRSFVTRSRTPTKKHKKHLVIDDFTILGLEAGTEHIQIALLNKDGTVECSAVLQVDVTLAPSGVGAFRIFKNTTVPHFKAADLEYELIHSVAPSPADTVKVGVCDTGVYDDAAAEDYLASHWVDGKYFDSAVGAGADRPTKPGGGHGQHILEESPSMHGTNVAGQAAWGTPHIKLLDVMVQRGQETGLITDDAATRAFTWARDNGAAVVNCSKILPFSKPHTDAFVSHADTKSRVLFLATGGNSYVSFPLHRPANKPMPGEIPADFVPRCFINTLWVGGCRADRTPHESRGHGPAIEVMVPSNHPSLYSPRPLRRAFRILMLQKVHADLPADLDALELNLGNPPAQLPGVLTPDEQEELDGLEAGEPPGGYTGPMGGIRARKLAALRLKQQPRPNPAVALKQAYHDVAAQLRAWAIDPASEQTRTATLLQWARNLFQANEDLRTDGTAGAHFGALAGVQGAARTEVRRILNETIDRKNLRVHATELENIGPNTPDIASDDGVSFGLPVVANIAAKLKLIDSSLTPNETKRILIDTSDIDPGFEAQCIARGLVNPLRAYLAAFDHDVSTGGRLHHDYAPVVSAAPDARPVHYTFFYMDSQGRDLYESIRDRLKADYMEMNIDLVEAEPPVRMKSERFTYVEGRVLGDHDWRKIVPMHHPLLHAPKHLRLILVNQAGMIENDGVDGVSQDREYPVVFDQGNGTWAPAVVPGGRVVVQNARAIPVKGSFVWVCTVRIDDAFPRHAFVTNPAHLVTKLTVLQAGDVPIDDARPASDLVEVQRLDDRRAHIIVRDATTNQRIQAQGRKVKLELGVVMLLGGARKGRNIFVNNNYHAGPSGTADAASSALVLFKHEIAHALGMVPPNGHAHYYNNKQPPAAVHPNPPVQDGKTGYGGDGDHCAFNTEDKPKAESPNYGVPNDAKSGLVKIPATLSNPGRAADMPCVMYHTRTSVHHRSTFCDECKRVLSAGTLEPKWSWPNDT